MTRQLISVPLVAPGSWGLNRQLSSTLLPPQFCLEATNCVIDDAGRVAARGGIQDSTTTPITGNDDIQVIHEYRQADGTTEIITAADGEIYTGTDTFSDISGTLTPAADNWQFLNFEDKCIGVQNDETPIVYTGTGNFTNITAGSGSLPTGNCGCAAYGRLWIVDTDDKTVKYCGLLDETDWGGAGAGSISMEEIWDVDTVQGIAAAFSRLIVFGQRSIVVFADSTGSTVGLDPANLYVEDIIEGTGLEARDSVQKIGEGDLWFLSPHGVQSFKRVIQEKNNPLVSVTDNVRDYLKDYVANETGDIRSAYNDKEGFYLLHFDTGAQFAISTKYQLQDGTYPVTRWINESISSVVQRDSGDMLFGMDDGQVGTYSTSLGTDFGTAFQVTYRSPWLDMGEDFAAFTKILKKWSSILFIQSAADVTFKIYTDFADDAVFTKFITLSGQSTSEWGVSEWGEDEWSGGAGLQEIAFNIAKTAQYIQLSVIADTATNFSLQQFNVIAKRGRMNI